VRFYKNNMSSKIVVILGPTASGKTGLGVKLAHIFNGEIVSADSRQVYRGMDIGTGKDLNEYSFEIDGKEINIPYHMIDVADPNEVYDVARFQRDAYRAIDDILKRGKLPIVVGGSGLYLQAIVDGFVMSDTSVDEGLRKLLEEKTKEELFAELENINYKFANNLNNSEKNNKRRLIRYIEINKSGVGPKQSEPRYDSLLLGLSWPREILRERIHKRIVDRLKNEDMIGEVERLNDEGVSWQRLIKFGLEYKFIANYLNEKMSYDEMVDGLSVATGKFAKRQETWFKRWEGQGREIKWIKDGEEAKYYISDFLGLKKG